MARPIAKKLEEELDHKALEALKKALEEKLGWEDSSQWKHGDYLKLSERIFAETKVKLNHNTLKRIWGKVDYKGKPSLSSRDALARFAGHADWKSFVRSEFREELKHVSAKDKPKAKWNKWISFGLGVLVLLVVGLWWLRKKGSVQETTKTNYKALELNVEPSTSTNPHEFQVHYHVNPLDTQRAPTLKVDYLHESKIVKPKGHYTFTYLLPGYAKARIMQGDSLLAEEVIYTQTKGWEAYYLDKSGHDYFPQVPLDTTKGYYSIRAAKLPALKVDTLNQNLYFNNIYANISKAQS